jgi:ABC-type uncharacterized transport system substrate-binding protein
MKKMKIEHVMIGLFMVVSLGLFGWFNITKPRILILHSYDKEYAWVRDINLGLNRVLSSKYLYQVRWYYMDTKRHPSSEYKVSAGIAARSVIEEMQPDVIIAIDDDAQQYATRYFVNHPKIKIVFAGVNNEASSYGFEKANNVTGILERMPLAAIREAFQIAGNFKSLNHPVQLAMLGDQSESVTGDAKQVQAFNWSPIQLVAINRVNTWPEWQAAMNELGKNADVILVTGYRRLKRSNTDSSLVTAKEVVNWTEKYSSIPVISGNGFYTEEGGMLAIGTSPYEQGEVAATKALEIILEKKSPNNIPIELPSQFIVTMNGSKMKARGFDLPKVYEAAARTGDKYYP